MAVYTVALKERKELAERTIGVSFVKPPNFEFKAGQFVDVSLLHPAEADTKGNQRALSIASAPHDDELLFATRLRDSAFKRVLNAMTIGTEVHIEGPFGSLVLHNDDARPAVCFAGGIGITPFRSIVRRASQDKLTHRLILFYSNRRPEDAPFLRELEALELDNPNYTFVPVMTALKQEGPSWSGETGHFTHELLTRYVDRTARPVFYIAGPPPMVEATRKMLAAAEVDDDDIRAEEFVGY